MLIEKCKEIAPKNIAGCAGWVGLQWNIAEIAELGDQVQWWKVYEIEMLGATVPQPVGMEPAKYTRLLYW